MQKHLPNFITCLNVFTGAIGCYYVLQVNFQAAIYFVILAGLFDFADGLVARALKVQSPIGKELDSLADVISFGLLPALFMVKLFQDRAPIYDFIPFFGLLIVVFSALRLAKFNVDDQQSDQFIGLPTPANAIMLTSLVFLPAQISLSWPSLLVITILSSFLLVAYLPLIALKFKGTGWAANKMKYILILLVALLLIVFQMQALPFIIPAYLIISFIGNFVEKNAV